MKNLLSNSVTALPFYKRCFIRNIFFLLPTSVTNVTLYIFKMIDLCVSKLNYNGNHMFYSNHIYRIIGWIIWWWWQHPNCACFGVFVLFSCYFIYNLLFSFG